MKVLVCVKRVVDPYVKIRVKSDQSDVDISNVKMAMNPFDEIAVEEAVKLKEAGVVSDIVAVTIGTQKSQETLRSALAIGADRAILVESEQSMEPLDVAKILKFITEKEEPNFIVMGKQSIDGDNNQTGQMLAALLGWPQGTFASEVKIDGDKATVTREIDGGLETVSFNLPGVITTDLRLNVPRYASLPNIMKAKKKPLDVISLADTGVTPKNRLEVQAVTEPATRQAGIMVESVDDLISKLKDEAKVI